MTLKQAQQFIGTTVSYMNITSKIKQVTEITADESNCKKMIIAYLESGATLNIDILKKQSESGKWVFLEQIAT